MDTRARILFLAKAPLALAAGLLVWEYTPISYQYHRFLATVGRLVYRDIVHDTIVHDMAVRNDEFAVRVRVGPDRETLVINAADVSGNACVLVALYAASPLRAYPVYLRYLVSALMVLFAAHLLALHIIIRAAVAGHGATASGWPDGAIGDAVSWMYPLAVLLWAPYLMMLRQAAKESARTATQSRTRRLRARHRR